MKDLAWTVIGTDIDTKIDQFIVKQAESIDKMPIEHYCQMNANYCQMNASLRVPNKILKSETNDFQ